jgi:hypothetical protein
MKKSWLCVHVCVWLYNIQQFAQQQIKQRWKELTFMMVQ